MFRVNYPGNGGPLFSAAGHGKDLTGGTAIQEVAGSDNAVRRVGSAAPR